MTDAEPLFIDTNILIYARRTWVFGRSGTRMYRLRSRGRKARCVSRAREQGAPTSNSRAYCSSHPSLEASREKPLPADFCEKPQRSYRVREACIAAENPCVTGIIKSRIHQSVSDSTND